MVKVNSKSQSGRSMVEMLGVLAIVGVLSVGGVYGYGVAMKKHKANELLHQASMLATTISAQAMTNNGTLPSTITSFGNTSYGTFSTSTTDALDGKGFSLKIEDVGFDVCNQLKEGGIVQKVDCDEATGDATITYYKNLATSKEEGEKSPTGESGPIYDPAQDCKEESCCDENLGDWKCPEFPDGQCICVPKDWDSDCTLYVCKACPTEESVVCGYPESSYSTCTCVPKGWNYIFDSWAATALACPPNQTPLCPASGSNNCICATSSDYACSNGQCIDCPGEKAYCSDYDQCICCPGEAVCDETKCTCST